MAKFNDPKWRALRDARIAEEKAAIEAGKLSTEALKVRVIATRTHTHTHTLAHTHARARACE